VVITMLSFIAILTCYCLFKICFLPSHSVKLFFLMYKLKEWTRKSKKQKFDQLKRNKEMEPLRHFNKVDLTSHLNLLMLLKCPLRVQTTMP
jgi:hypothetical protein